MGTDIHAFVEVDYCSDCEPFAESDSVRCFNRGEFFVWRDYDLFDALGNGRSNDVPLAERKRSALFPPRGLPPNMSDAVFERYYHIVAEPRLNANRPGGYGAFSLGLRPVTSDEAQRWVAEGRSHYYPPTEDVGALGRRYVSNPAWHSPSWLWLPEVRQSLEHFGLDLVRMGPDVRIILLAMEEFERSLGQGQSRLVFWFDN